jgi:hypothetical protein
MPGCAVLLFIALIILVAAPDLGASGLPSGFVVGLVAGLLLSLAGVWSAGWNAHVATVEDRGVARAHDEATRDRR